MSNFFEQTEKLEFGKMLAEIRNGLQSITEAIDKFLSFLGAVEQGIAWNPANITWSPQEGGKGPYERASEQSGQDFLMLIKDLESHNGKLQNGGYFYWLFSNSRTIGRKPSKRKKAEITQN